MPGKWEFVRGPEDAEEDEAGSGKFPDADQNDKLKGKLYPYLRERAKRRMETQSGVQNRELEGQFAEDRARYDQGAFLGILPGG